MKQFTSVLLSLAILVGLGAFGFSAFMVYNKLEPYFIALDNALR